MRKCRNWQTSKTKDLVTIAVVWVQVPSSALLVSSRKLCYTRFPAFFISKKEICIAKYDPNAENRIEKNVDYENVITLPRLSLGYYLILAVAALAIMGIIWFLTRKKAELRVWAERIGLYPAAYIISHCIVSGINWASYSLPRDFALIVFISILLYSGLLLAHNVWRLKREIKEINR